MNRLACLLPLLLGATIASAGADWPQLQGDALRSGNAPAAEIPADLGLLAAVPLSDGIYAAPAVADGTVYAVDGSGVVYAICTETLQVRWTFATRGGPGNVNNVSSPAVVGPYLHLGTMAGYYYVLDRENGAVVRELDCREPIFSAPAVGDRRVYFATLGARVYAVEPDGEVAWTWDFVREVVDFDGDRWSGEAWLAARGDRVTWRDHFVCSRDICLLGNTVVIPAGGRTVFLDDAGAAPELRAVGEIPSYVGREYPATFGQSADAAGNVYVQWHRRDNAGRLDVLRLTDDGVRSDVVPGTETAIDLPGLLAFASVSIRDGHVYRVRPEHGLGLCRHMPGAERPEVLAAAASISPPVLTREHAVYGGLDGRLHVARLAGGEVRSYPTAFGTPISAPLAVAGGRVYVGGEDGYLYVFGAGGRAALPDKKLGVEGIRSPLAGPLAGPEYDWYTNYGDFQSTNANNQGLEPPLRMRWVRRLAGTVKHIPVCGGGRMYVHTAEGQILAMEQDTGRLLWRRYWPGVYLSFTSPLYIDGKLLVPQAGIRQSYVRCLDAATGELLWEAPFSGSPSWSRQFPPVVHGNVAIYASGSGEYAAQGSEKPFTFRGAPQPTPDGREVMSWIYSNDNPYYPRDNRPLLWAWDLDTGELLWQRDFSEYGRGGNDCGLCLYDGKLYYSTFFGYAASQRARRGLPPENNGLTACLDPATGEVIWLTTEYFVTAKCTVSARDGRLYLGGHNRASERTNDRFVWCLDARDGSLIWQSDAVTSALNVVTVGERFVFSNALRGRGNVFDRETGKVVAGVGHNYACCRFTLSEPYVLGANMDMIDLAAGGKLVSTGPAIDSRECLGAIISNGRMFYVSQASGFIVSQTYGAEARRLPAVWERDASTLPRARHKDEPDLQQVANCHEAEHQQGEKGKGGQLEVFLDQGLHTGTEDVDERGHEGESGEPADGGGHEQDPQGNAEHARRNGENLEGDGGERRAEQGNEGVLVVQGVDLGEVLRRDPRHVGKKEPLGRLPRDATDYPSRHTPQSGSNPINPCVVERPLGLRHRQGDLQHVGWDGKYYAVGERQPEQRRRAVRRLGPVQHPQVQPFDKARRFDGIGRWAFGRDLHGYSVWGDAQEHSPAEWN